MTIGANYGKEKFTAFQSARNANPPCALNVPPCAAGTYDSWFDPNRTWNLDNDETVNNFMAYVDLVRGDPEDRHPRSPTTTATRIRPSSTAVHGSRR